MRDFDERQHLSGNQRSHQYNASLPLSITVVVNFACTLELPHTCASACAASKSDVISEGELRRLLSEVDLEYLVEREGGLDAVVDWGSQLSLGEQQRLGMARLFYHRPKFAILDECTSGVTVSPHLQALPCNRRELCCQHRALLEPKHNSPCSSTICRAG